MIIFYDQLRGTSKNAPEKKAQLLLVKENFTGKAKTCFYLKWAFLYQPPTPLYSHPHLKLRLSYSSVLLGLAFCSLCLSRTHFIYKFPSWHWKSCSPPQQDLCEQCHQILRLFISAARSALWMMLCKAWDCSCWRQAAAGLACVGVIREMGLNSLWFHVTFLVCHISTFVVLLVVWGFFSLPGIAQLSKPFD